MPIQCLSICEASAHRSLPRGNTAAIFGGTNEAEEMVSTLHCCVLFIYLFSSYVGATLERWPGTQISSTWKHDQRQDYRTQVKE